MLIGLRTARMPIRWPRKSTMTMRQNHPDLCLVCIMMHAYQIYTSTCCTKNAYTNVLIHIDYAEKIKSCSCNQHTTVTWQPHYQPCQPCPPLDSCGPVPSCRLCLPYPPWLEPLWPPQLRLAQRATTTRANWMTLRWRSRRGLPCP